MKEVREEMKEMEEYRGIRENGNITNSNFCY